MFVSPRSHTNLLCAGSQQFLLSCLFNQNVMLHYNNGINLTLSKIAHLSDLTGICLCPWVGGEEFVCIVS